jgi:phosphate transport system permease protein
MSAIPDPQHSLTASGNLRRRQLTSRFFVGATVSAAAIAVIVLVILVYYVAKQGLSVMSLSFFTSNLPGYDGQGGGIGPALVGTMELVVIATLIALPVGVLTALYLTQYAGPRPDRIIRMMIDLMAGLPTIIAGVFVAGLITNSVGPSSLESISRVPPTLVEAADALGVARWRGILGVILPTASNGIVTATILAVARASGETAPLLFTSELFTQQLSLNPRSSVASVPLVIFQFLEAGYPASVAKAWGAAFTLMAVILAANIGARVWLRRSQRKRGL